MTKKKMNSRLYGYQRRNYLNPQYLAGPELTANKALEVFTKEGEEGVLRQYGWKNTKEALRQIFYLKAVNNEPIDSRFTTNLIYLYLNCAASGDKAAKAFARYVKDGFQMALAQLKEENKVTQAEFRELEQKFEKVSRQIDYAAPGKKRSS